MSTIPDQPCAHPGCGCKVQKAGQYCSESCRRQEDAASTDGCQCGHSDCIVQEALERTDPGKR